MRGGNIEQWLAREGQGGSSGYRLLIAYRSGDRAVFLYGFAKSEQDNIRDDQLETLREIGATWLEADRKRLEHEVKAGNLQEVSYDKGRQET